MHTNRRTIRRTITAAFILFALLQTQLWAQTPPRQVVLWNAQQLFSVAQVNGARATDLTNFGAHFSDADVIILDEITSLDVVNAARDKVGYSGFHTACSDFAQNDDNQFGSLEVGIISRHPLTNVLEFDQTPMMR